MIQLRRQPDRPITLFLLASWILPWGSLPNQAIAATTDFPPQLTSPQLTSPSQAPAQTFVQEDYTLGPGDRLKVDVLKAPQYALDTAVLVDGTLGLIQVGRLSVQGLTLVEAQEQASRLYGSILRYPVVTLTPVSPRPIKVAVTGEVSRRGSYDLTGSGPEGNANPTPFPTLTRALKVAGGITQAADLNRIQIQRLGRNGGVRSINPHSASREAVRELK